MKSIREFNTTGMYFSEREELFQNVEPIELGTIVWYSGDCFESVTPIKVTGKNQKEISMFWNSLYFDTIEQAEQRNNVAHALYGKYQASAMG